MIPRWSLVLVAAAAGSCTLPVTPMVDLQVREGAVVVFIDRQHFTTYNPAVGERSKPYLFPVIGAAGRPMTRVYPLAAAAPGEQSDHPHHTGIWFAHGDVNGVDFWHGPGKGNGGRIVQEALVYYSGITGWLETTNRYEDRSGKTIGREFRKVGFFANEHGRFIDFDIAVQATEGDLVMGDTKEGLLAIRLPAALRLQGEVAGGAALTSAGVRGAKGWGTRGAWADCHGEIDGAVVGVAIFDHPDNPRHPTRWVIRDYGLFAANPFGLHAFEGAPAGSGAVTIPAGRQLRFRYRLFFHAGNPEQARVAEHYQRYATDKSGWR